ncbi:MAG: hypothetical protein AAB268_01340 [Elusimicrobiota bacterium]
MRIEAQTTLMVAYLLLWGASFGTVVCRSADGPALDAPLANGETFDGSGKQRADGWRPLLSGIRARASKDAHEGTMMGIEADSPLMVRAKLDASVTEVILDIDGSADIEFRPSADVFSASDMRFEHSDNNPVTITVENGRAVLRQKGRRVHARYVVSIPEDRAVTVSVGSANLSGELKARSLEFSAGALNLKARLTVTDTLSLKCGSANLDAEVLESKEIKLLCGSAGGRLIVPDGAKLPWVPFWFGLKINKH